MNELPLSSLKGNGWSSRAARADFPILVEYARKRKAITYGDWDREIVTRKLGNHVHLTNYGHPAGIIGDACEEYAKLMKLLVPMLNLLVINADTKIPGEGANYYIEQYCQRFLKRDYDPNKLSTNEKRSIIDNAHGEIFDFPHWAQVLHAFGLKETPFTKHEGHSQTRRQPDRHGWHCGPESEAHKMLKQRIAKASNLVGLAKGLHAIEEHLLWSGDEIDVYFPKAALGVEVKTKVAKFDELHRGIFQCVKYKAVLRAQQISDQIIPTADCVLALGGDLPKELQELAGLLQVNFFENLADN